MTKADPSLTKDKTVLAARILGYGGALPFLGGAIATNQQMALLGCSPAYLLLSYGAVILSFLGGLHWGRVITSPRADRHPEFVWLIWSVCPSLLGWAALLMPEKAGALALSLCFLVALKIDQKFLRDQIWPAWMRPLRFNLSLVAVACLTSIIIY